MTADRLRRVEQIFAALIDMDGDGNGDGIGPATRLRNLSARAAGMCDGDASICAEVESLLHHHFQAEGDSRSAPSNDRDTQLIGRFLDPDELRGLRGERIGLGTHELLADWANTGTRIGGYTIIGQLGAGGMGVVYVAEQDRPRRTVALKLIRQGLATPALVRRFEREADVLGRLSHPGIAQIFEAGVAELDVVARTIPVDAAIDGAALARSRHVVPFIAMELVRGPNILEYVRFAHATPAQCMALIACVCDAVQHAHQRGVIHRDLKPQNILVGAGASLDSPPQPKVLDFGVARAIDPQTDPCANLPPEPHTITLDGQMVGTLAYMSPEQISGSSRDTDTRADVYALGAILYHLLSGRAPFDTSTRSLPELAKAICSEEPVALGSINRSFRGDVETIVRKAIAKDKLRRYQSAAELGEDLRRYLRGEAIAAKQDSALYVIRKQVKRHRTLVVAALLAIASLISLAVYATIEEKRMARTAHLAVAAADEEQLQRARADATAARLARQLSASHIEQGRLLAMNGDFHTAEALIWEEHLQHPESIRSRWALWELYARYPCERTIAAHEGEVRCIAWRPDGKAFATGGDDQMLRIWDAASGKHILEIRTPHRMLSSVAFTRDGATLATAGYDGPIILWDANRGTKQRELTRHRGPVYSLALSPDGKLLASGGNDGQVLVWDLASGNLLASASTLDAQNNPVPVKVLRIDSQGTRVAAGADDGSVRIWSLPDGPGKSEPLKLNAHRNVLSSLAFTPDGTMLASGSVDKTIKFWNLADGSLIKSLDTSNGTARDLDFSPDGKSLASVGWWRVDVWDVQRFERLHGRTEPAAGYPAWQARFDSSGKHLAIAGSLGIARVWSMDSGGGVEVLPGHSSVVVSVAAKRRASDESIVLASTGNDGVVNLWTRVGEKWVRREPPIRSGLTLRQVALSDDGQIVAASGTDGSINLWSTISAASIAHQVGHRGLAAALTFTHDGRYLLSGGADGTFRIWQRSADGAWSLLKTIEDQPGETLGVSISADDRIAATSHRGAVVRFWSIPDGRLLATRSIESAAWLPAFANHHPRIGLATWDRVVEMWDVSQLFGAQSATAPTPASATMPSDTIAPRLAHFIGHTQLVCGAAFNDDDSLLASSGQDGLVKVWDGSVGTSDQSASDGEFAQQSLLTLDAQAGEAFQAVFLPPPLDHCVAVGYRDGAVRIWDLSHFNKHIAGQIEYQIKAHANEPVPADNIAVLRAWARLNSQP